MGETATSIQMGNLPFFITAPGQTDGLFIGVTIAFVLIIIGFGALYLAIQAIPDRFATGASKVQLQIVGILGLLSLITFNNAFWLAGLFLAAIRIPDFVTPLKGIAKSLEIQTQNAQAEKKPAPARSKPRKPATKKPPQEGSD